MPACKPRQRYKNMRVILTHAAPSRQGFLGRSINACCPGLIAQKAVYGVAKCVQCGKSFTARHGGRNLRQYSSGFCAQPGKTQARIRRRRGLPRCFHAGNAPAAVTQNIMLTADTAPEHGIAKAVLLRRRQPAGHYFNGISFQKLPGIIQRHAAQCQLVPMHRLRILHSGYKSKTKAFHQHHPSVRYLQAALLPPL